MKRSSDRPHSRPRSKIMYGDGEPIFSVLPASVLRNMEIPGSENALLWNTIYPLADPAVSYHALVNLPPLWGTVKLEVEEDQLEPYFWGYNVLGEKLPGLEQALHRIDGQGPFTEVDLILLGKNNLLSIEVKHLANLGRCSRYTQGRCPEIHQVPNGDNNVCRYWEDAEHGFRRYLDFGERPMFDDPSPPCDQHYQLARTLLVGSALAEELQMKFGLWLLVSKTRWRSIEKKWCDFADRVKHDGIWRRMRVVAWEELRTLKIS